MSYEHSKRVWETDLKGGKLLVMLALAQFADSNGECYPGMATLACMARVTDRHVRRIINELEKSGHIAIMQRAVGRGNKPRYKLFPCLKVDKMSAFSVEEMPQESGQNVNITAEKADISDNKSGHFHTLKADISEQFQSYARSEQPIEQPIEQNETATQHATLDDEVDFAPTVQPPKPVPEKKLTPQQAMYGAICEALGWDYHVIAEREKIRVAQAVKILTQADYTVEDIRRFMVEIWFNDWRWEKKAQRPTLEQLRQEIGKLRAGIPVDIPPPSQTKAMSSYQRLAARNGVQL